MRSFIIEKMAKTMLPDLKCREKIYEFSITKIRSNEGLSCQTVRGRVKHRKIIKETMKSDLEMISWKEEWFFIQHYVIQFDLYSWFHLVK